jgi:hypothetical protein
MKADAGWKELEDKMEGRDVGYRDVRVVALVAVQPCQDQAAAALLPDPSCTLPSEVGLREVG